MELAAPGARATFVAAPDTALAKDSKTDLLIGVSLFDPVSGARIEATDDAPNSIFKGVKYVFATNEEKAKFDKSPAKFTAAPAKEALHCPVEDGDVASYADAGGYVDSGRVRIYVCCAQCLSVLRKHTSEYAAKVGKFIKPAKPEMVKAS